MMMMSLHFRVMDLYSKQKCLQNTFSAEQQPSFDLIRTILSVAITSDHAA